MKSVYIHIPFCEKICSYCDFCKMFYNEKQVDKYLDELEREIKSLYKEEVLDTLYIGGGTPSCLSLRQLERLFQITNFFNKSDSIEFTIECNFSSTTLEKLMLCKKYGVNRLSFGLETINKRQLQFLEREENKNQVLSIIQTAKDIGFDNINVDLMYALPGESIDELKEDLEFIKSLNVEHVSCYSLIIEKHTKLDIGNVKSIDADLDYEMYKCICAFMSDNGFRHYEISNYAKEGFESRHNTVYWDNKEYYGFGLGASSYIENSRITNTRSINKYLEGKYVLETEYLEKEDLIYYEIMLNLRKCDGIHLDELYCKYNVKLEYDELIRLGLLCKKNNMLNIP